HSRLPTLHFRRRVTGPDYGENVILAAKGKKAGPAPRTSAYSATSCTVRPTDCTSRPTPCTVLHAAAASSSAARTRFLPIFDMAVLVSESPAAPGRLFLVG